MSIPATWLYVATGANGVRKVGSTINPANKPRMLREAYWQPFVITRTWHRPEADARPIERIAHALLRSYRDLERDLVWELYRAPLAVIYDAIEVAALKAAAGDLSDLPRQSAFVRTQRNPEKLAAYQHWQREWAARLAT